MESTYDRKVTYFNEHVMKFKAIARLLLNGYGLNFKKRNIIISYDGKKEGEIFNDPSENVPMAQCNRRKKDLGDILLKSGLALSCR